MGFPGNIIQRQIQLQYYDLQNQSYVPPLGAIDFVINDSYILILLNVSVCTTPRCSLAAFLSTGARTIASSSTAWSRASRNRMP